MEPMGFAPAYRALGLGMVATAAMVLTALPIPPVPVLPLGHNS